MVIRTYFTRNNTIISNQVVNTGQNPVTELFYGTPTTQAFSRFICQFDVDRIISMRNNGMFPDLTKFKHTLRMTNTGAFDTTLMGAGFEGMERSSSFDLIVFPITQEWDEGVGFDYFNNNYLSDVAAVSTSPSNWFESGTNTAWSDGNGVYSGSPTILASQHFEHGNENLEIDVTDIVNAYLSGDTNYGIGIAYTENLEQTIRDNAQYVGFFTRHTQTFYEPHVESIYNDRISDDRVNFYLGKDNRLYLYVNVGGIPTNLDNLPTVNVMDDDENIVLTASGINASQGVYYVDINIPNNGENDCTMFTDIWSNLSVNGISQPDVELDFSVKSEGYFNIGTDGVESKKYGFTVNGINNNETIKRGDIRKVIVNAKIPYTANQNVALDNIEYRIYVKEGRNQFTVIDFQLLNKAFNQNYFLLDTQSLLPNTYYLEVKYSSDYEVHTSDNIIKFEIVSQSELRKSQ